MMNEDLRAMVEALNSELKDVGNIQLRYSDALATADLSRAELLHPIDGWRASGEGHNVRRQGACSDLGASLDCLRIQYLRAPRVSIPHALKRRSTGRGPLFTNL